MALPPPGAIPQNAMPRGGGLPPAGLPGGGMGPPPGAIPQGAPMQIAASGQPQRWTFGASGAGRMPTVEESDGPPGQPGVPPPAPVGPPGEPPQGMPIPVPQPKPVGAAIDTAMTPDMQRLLLAQQMMGR